MNVIKLKKMEFYGYHGCMEKEKIEGQKFYVSINLFLPEVKGSLTDNLEETVDYSKVYEAAKEITENERFNLIEKLAREIGKRVIDDNPMVKRAEVTVSKPSAPIEGVFETMEVTIPVTRRQAIISFGSNMGDREDNIRQALSMLENNPYIKVERVSSLYETEPVGYLNQDNFLNGCAVLKTTLEPLELLEFMLGKELELHRVRTIKNGPRTIDLDILTIDNLKMNTEKLCLPHPRMYERAFVLVPLKELGLYNGEIPEGSAVKLYKAFGAQN